MFSHSFHLPARDFRSLILRSLILSSESSGTSRQIKARTHLRPISRERSNPNFPFGIVEHESRARLARPYIRVCPTFIAVQSIIFMSHCYSRRQPPLAISASSVSPVDQLFRDNGRQGIGASRCTDIPRARPDEFIRMNHSSSANTSCPIFLARHSINRADNCWLDSKG